MWAGAYEPELISPLKRALKLGMNVLDLRANIGYFSVIAAALVGENGQSGHWIQLDEPDFVIESIREVAESVGRRSSQ